MTIQIKAIEQCFHVALFIMLYKLKSYNHNLYSNCNHLLLSSSLSSSSRRHTKVEAQPVIVGAGT